MCCVPHLSFSKRRTNNNQQSTTNNNNQQSTTYRYPFVAARTPHCYCSSPLFTIKHTVSLPQQKREQRGHQTPCFFPTSPSIGYTVQLQKRKTDHERPKSDMSFKEFHLAGKNEQTVSFQLCSRSTARNKIWDKNNFKRSQSASNNSTRHFGS